MSKTLGLLEAHLIAFMVLIGGSFAKAEFLVPNLRGPVMDQVGILRNQEHRQLENILREYNQAGKAQIQVLIVSDLQGFPIEQASIEIVEKWKLGTEKKDNGILFLIAIKDRKMRIEVGQGLEGALTDVESKRILDDVVRPLFRSQHYGEGILAGLVKILERVDSEYVGQLEALPTKKPFSDFIIMGLMFVFIILAFLSKLFGGGFYGRRNSWYGGGGFGGGGWSGGSGGGWSGGGGGFSGGGSSSNW